MTIFSSIGDKWNELVDPQPKVAAVKTPQKNVFDAGVQEDLGKDLRARLKTKSNSIFQGIGDNSSSNLLEPLAATSGIVFPYTPTVTYGVAVNYDDRSYTHTNYKQLSYKYSAVDEMQISAIFTSQTITEARYTLAVWHFLNVVTKSQFGVSNPKKAGMPPPVLLFDYLGEHMFNSLPVVVKRFTTNFPNDVDYVYVESPYGVSSVPTQITFDLTVDMQVNPDKVRDEFNLDKFASGGFLKGYR